MRSWSALGGTAFGSNSFLSDIPVLLLRTPQLTPYPGEGGDAWIEISVPFLNEAPTVQRRLVVIAMLVGALGQLYLVTFDFLIRNDRQKVRYDVQPTSALVVGSDQMPGGMIRIGGVEHPVASLGVFVPAAVGFDIHRAQLPLPERIGDAGFEAPILLLHADLQPNLDELNTAADHVVFHFRTELEKAFALLRTARAHHRLHAGAIIPTAVEDGDLAGRRKLLQVALHEELCLFAV